MAVEFNSEIPRLELSPETRTEPSPYQRRELLQNQIEAAGYVSPTRLAVEEPGIRTDVLLIAAGQMVSEGRIIPTDRGLTCELRVKIATVSGKPLASKTDKSAHLRGVKTGLRPLDAAALRSLQSRGGTAVITRDYPASFECSLQVALKLLTDFGFRLSGPSPAKWLIYEVGGPLESEVAEWLTAQARETGDEQLSARAREICPGAQASPPEPEGKRRGAR